MYILLRCQVYPFLHWLDQLITDVLDSVYILGMSVYIKHISLHRVILNCYNIWKTNIYLRRSKFGHFAINLLIGLGPDPISRNVGLVHQKTALRDVLSFGSQRGKSHAFSVESLQPGLVPKKSRETIKIPVIRESKIPEIGY